MKQPVEVRFRPSLHHDISGIGGTGNYSFTTHAGDVMSRSPAAAAISRGCTEKFPDISYDVVAEPDSMRTALQTGDDISLIIFPGVLKRSLKKSPSSLTLSGEGAHTPAGLDCNRIRQDIRVTGTHGLAAGAFR